MPTVDSDKTSSPFSKDGYQKENGFFNRPMAGGKTMWDWLNLLGILAIPLILGIATIGFGLQQTHLADQQHQSDQKLAQQQHVADQQQVLDQQRAAVLQTYLDSIQDLLLNHNLLGSKPTDDVAILARARTLTALQGLDPERKGRLMKFLYEAELIGFDDLAHFPKFVHKDSVINLSEADLSNIDLNNVIFTGVNLSGAILNAANLSNAKLELSNVEGANLSQANLQGADLGGTDLLDASLNGANLSHAFLVGSNLSRTDVRGANLTSAILFENVGDKAIISQLQLDEVYSCKNAYLPQDLTCHQNR